MTVLTSTASVQFDQGGPAEVSATVRLNGGSRIYCHRYEDAAPILSITDAHIRMSRVTCGEALSGHSPVRYGHHRLRFGSLRSER